MISVGKRASSPVARVGPRWPWEPFVWAAIWLTLTAGFGTGALLFGVLAAGVPVGLWWPVHAQIHGHAQVFGWLGLMVIGVGLHFLPRLRGANLAAAGLVKPVFWLLVGGLVLRSLVQPLVGSVRFVAVEQPVRVTLVASGAMELLGVMLVLVMLVLTIRNGPPLTQRSGFHSTWPFFAAGFAGLVLALVVSLGALMQPVGGSALLPPNWHQASLDLGIAAFLVPVALAMSARTFPLYVRTVFPSLPLLRIALGLIWFGAVVAAIGVVFGLPPIVGPSRIGLGAGLLLAGAAMQIFRPRRRLPRGPVEVWTSPAQWHAMSAYAWLVVGGLIELLTGLGAIGVPTGVGSLDAARHALGAGFLTLLVFGVGTDLFPGFATGPVASRNLLWATLILGNTAALLRVGPALLPVTLPALQAIGGLAGTAAVICFAVNIRRSTRSVRRSGAT